MSEHSAESDALAEAAIEGASPDMASALRQLADAWPDHGVLMPVCVWGCDWTAGPMRDTPENNRVLGPVVIAHKAECPGRVTPPAARLTPPDSERAR